MKTSDIACIAIGTNYVRKQTVMQTETDDWIDTLEAACARCQQLPQMADAAASSHYHASAQGRASRSGGDGVAPDPN
ncbi:MAG: hypothetical protein HY054_08075 [Proteobacteria bacterium]|nr:hypothetical protein [Pseudomonadota bacterium]